MPLLPTLGRTVGTGIKAARMMVRGSVRGGAWATRRVGTARAKGAANEIGMIRLFDLHAVSCAGDTLIAIGLAGTIFFNVPLGEARSKVALYLLITMIPFALLAPVVGPLLDHFRHGRRYALAATMLGRAFLAYVISDHLFGWGLYPAAFGVLALSRAYGVARSAAVPRLLPEGVGLSQVGARASVYGTFAGAVVAPLGLLAFKIGPQWPLRVATVIFVVGMVISLRLPPRADSDPPEAVPRPWRAALGLGRGGDRPLSGKLVIATLIGSASLRLLYGFLLLFLAFVIMAGQLDTMLLGRDIGNKGAVGLIGGALAVGTFLSTAAGTRLRIRRPLALQSAGLTITAGVAVLSAIFYSLAMLALLALVTAIFSGISKLAIDASIQERVPERLRASAFAHSETVLMIAWVAGGAIGIIPLPGRLGIAVAALIAVAMALRAGWAAARLHGEHLSGRAGALDEASPDAETETAQTGAAETGSTSNATTHNAEPTDPWPDAPTVPVRNRPNPPATGTRTATRPSDRTTTRASDRAATRAPDHAAARPSDRTATPMRSPDRTRIDSASATSVEPGLPPTSPPIPDISEKGGSRGGRRWGFGKRKQTPPPAPRSTPPPAPSSTPPAPTSRSAPPQSASRSTPPASAPSSPAAEPARPDPALAPPGYHVYRPSSVDNPASSDRREDDDR
ncbi:MFS transporter [Actinoplanes sp. CA-142083]|uniref:MFS transporter n=1 Tax=Actinoplanes sp. CA-142083 TaxID=3239903 RepID=UPI003D8B4019